MENQINKIKETNFQRTFCLVSLLFKQNPKIAHLKDDFFTISMLYELDGDARLQAYSDLDRLAMDIYSMINDEVNTSVNLNICLN